MIQKKITVLSGVPTMVTTVTPVNAWGEDTVYSISFRYLLKGARLVNTTGTDILYIIGAGAEKIVADSPTKKI